MNQFWSLVFIKNVDRGNRWMLLIKISSSFFDSMVIFHNEDLLVVILCGMINRSLWNLVARKVKLIHDLVNLVILLVCF